MLTVVFVKESPRWLAWKQRPEAARSALARLRGGARHIPDELEEIHAVASQLRYGYGSIPINTIFNMMNIHLPAILMFTRGTRFWHTAISFEMLKSKSCPNIGLPSLSGRTNVKKYWNMLEIWEIMAERSCWDQSPTERSTFYMFRPGIMVTFVHRFVISCASITCWFLSWHRSSPAAETKKKHDSETETQGIKTPPPPPTTTLHLELNKRSKPHHRLWPLCYHYVAISQEI